MDGRLFERLAVRLAVFGALALFFIHPALVHAAQLNEFRDSQVLMLYERSAVDTVRHFGELPLWNPYYCGGLDALGEPQSRFASPTFLLSLLFGAERAEVVVFFVMAVLGMEGMYRWLRTRTDNAAAATVVAPVFALSGHFSVAFYRGWTAFSGFELVPWVLFGIALAARGRVAGIACAAIAFATILGFGGTFAAPLVAIAAVVEALLALQESTRSARPRAFLMLGATALFMFTVSLLRLWPVAETLSAAPRIMAGTPSNETRALVHMLTGKLAVKDGDVEATGSFYVGWTFLLVAAFGSVSVRGMKRLAAAIFFMLLAAGYAAKPSFFGLLRQLPVFAEVRYPERFLWVAILYFSDAAVLGIAHVAHVAGGKRAWRAAVVAAVVGAVTLGVARQVAAFERVAGARELGAALAPRTEDFRQSRGNRWLATHYESLGVGSLSCWETHSIAMSRLLRSDLPAEEYLADGARGKASRVAWSPESITVDVSLDAPGRLLVNQNWHPGWRASIGSVVSNEGLLAVDLPAGHNAVTLAFRPWSAIGGGLATCSALFALAVLGLRARRGRRPFTRGTWFVTGALTLLPLGVAAAAHRFAPEPPWPAPAPTNANGSPALVEGPTVGSEELGTVFALPLTVEAGRVSGPDAHGNILVDVWFRRTDALPHASTMFVHLDRRPGETAHVTKDKDERTEHHFNVDHQIVGGTFYLADVPERRLVHDAFGAHISKAAPGTWDVYVAFGDVSGVLPRAKVRAPGHGTISEDRVRVGTFVVH